MKDLYGIESDILRAPSDASPVVVPRARARVVRAPGLSPNLS